MAVSRSRSPSGDDSGPNKKARREAVASVTTEGLNLPDAISLAEQYQAALPYKYVSVGDLFEDKVLEGVVTESKSYGTRHTESAKQGWGWEQKETDIYKIQQTPDLTSLTTEHLPDETLECLPWLRKLKDQLYSTEFVRKVTGCGPLSGQKVDGSVGLYTKGSHLLLHDDSISTRVVSYILYLPHSPSSAPSPTASSSSANTFTPSASSTFTKGWDPAWGGSLELFPVSNTPPSDNVTPGPPASKSTHFIPASWGNLIFFEVQPGKSYHSVEEVVVGEGRERLGVSGWFHRPIEGEEGYEVQDGEEVRKQMSSLAQITSAPSAPASSYPESEAPPEGLTSSHLKLLSKYLAPSYLNASTLEKLSGQFAENSEIMMHNLLKPDVAEAVKRELAALDEKQYSPLVREDGFKLITKQDLGETDSWEMQGPSSKHRYLSLSAKSRAASTSETPTLHSILTELYPSQAFRAWIQVVSSLIVLSYKVEARRFRKGLDYTLAGGEDHEGEPKLDAVLNLSWWAKDEDEAEEAKDSEEKPDVGGWECYLAAPEPSSDPAVYQSNRGGKVNGALADGGHVEPADPASGSTSNGNGELASASKAKPKITMGGVELEFDESQLSDGDFDTDSEPDDGPLLTLPLSFNRMLLVLRDPGVMKFVKYWSNAAEGSRWDVAAEFDVGQLAEEGDEEQE